MAETTQDKDQLLRTRSLTENDIQESPWAYYQAMHEQGFYFDERLNMFVCADYALLRDIIRNPKLFSNVNSQNVSTMRTPPEEVLRIQRESERVMDILVAADPPDHTRIRKLLDAPFRPRAIETWRPQIQDIVHNVIDAFIDRGAFDAVADFAVPIPITVIADMLGLDRSYADTIKTWSDASVEPLGMMISDERWIECARIIQEFQAFIADQLNRRRTDPQADLLTHLVQATDEEGKPLSLGEMLGITQQILVAGNETTTNGIAAGVQLLIDNPDQQRALRDNPDRMYTFVNEALRLESPVQGLFRMVTADTEIAGIPVPAGSRIMLRYAAANRDGKKYAQPDSVDIFRTNAGTQVGFGAGIHHCLGANLAREEMFQSFSILLERVEGLAYTPDANTFEHHPSMILRGLKALHVTFTKAAS